MKPPAAHKWGAMIVSTIDYVEKNIESIKASTDKFEETKNALAVLKAHSAQLDDISKLSAVKLHCESRITCDSVSCILIIHSAAYSQEVDAMVVIMTNLIGVKPCEGPAPPTKAERKALRMIRGSKD